MEPGTKLREILHSLGINPMRGCRCRELIKLMDEWGADGCQEHFGEIVTQLEEDAAKYKWQHYVTAAKKAWEQRLTFKIDWINPIPSLVREAIIQSKVPDRRSPVPGLLPG